jgi:hypothetical protein
MEAYISMTCCGRRASNAEIAGNMPRSRCLLCDNVGVVIEYRLVWKTPAAGNGSLAVDSEAEGWQQAGKLAVDCFDVDVISGARRCSCRMAKAIQKRERRKEKVEDSVKVEPRDWKMAQAGDR